MVPRCFGELLNFENKRDTSFGGLTKNIERKKRERGKRNILGTILRLFIRTVQYHSLSFQYQFKRNTRVCHLTFGAVIYFATALNGLHEPADLCCIPPKL